MKITTNGYILRQFAKAAVSMGVDTIGIEVSTDATLRMVARGDGVTVRRIVDKTEAKWRKNSRGAFAIPTEFAHAVDMPDYEFAEEPDGIAINGTGLVLERSERGNEPVTRARNDQGVHLKAGALAKAIRDVRWANFPSCPKVAMYSVSDMAIYVRDATRFRLAKTDGHGLAETLIPPSATWNVESRIDSEMRIPMAVVEAFHHISPPSEDMASIYSDGEATTLAVGPWEINGVPSKLPLPPFVELVPPNTPNSYAWLNSRDALSMLKAASVIAENVSISCVNGRLRFYAGTGLGTYQNSMPGKNAKAAKFAVKVSIGMLRDALTAANRHDEWARIWVKKAAKTGTQCVVIRAGEYTAMIAEVGSNTEPQGDNQ